MTAMLVCWAERTIYILAYIYICHSNNELVNEYAIRVFGFLFNIWVSHFFNYFLKI